MIDSILIQDIEEQYAPPEKLLNLAVVGDILFVEIVKYDETSNERHMETQAKIAVDAEVFRHALELMRFSDSKPRMSRLSKQERAVERSKIEGQEDEKQEPNEN